MHAREAFQRSPPSDRTCLKGTLALHTSTSKPENLIVKSNLFECFWTFLIVLLIIFIHIYERSTFYITESVDWNAAVCVKLGRNTEKQTEKEGEEWCLLSCLYGELGTFIYCISQKCICQNVRFFRYGPTIPRQQLSLRSRMDIESDVWMGQNVLKKNTYGHCCKLLKLLVRPAVRLSWWHVEQEYDKGKCLCWWMCEGGEKGRMWREL